MDRVKDYVEKLNMKNAVIGGFDKESVYVSLKELVAIFEEELEKSQKECKELQKKIQDMDQVSIVHENTNTEIFSEINRLNKYMEAYQNTKKELDKLEKENADLDRFNKKIKEESQKEIAILKQQIQELSSYTKNDSLLALDYLKNNFNLTIDQLSQSFIQQNEEILQENQRLKEENQTLNKLIEEHQKAQKENQQHFVDEINQLYNNLELLKNKYIKGEE